MATIDVPLSSPSATPGRDPVTFEALYERQFGPMVRLAYTLVDTRQQAEEVVQDSFAAVYERFHRLDNPEAYLRVTVLNGCRRVLRRRMLSRRQPVPPSEDTQLGASHVVDAIRRLPHRQRSMVVLRYDLQLTDREIAETLGVPIGTVKSTIHRALAELRKELS
jgi:RNA polymerase sigma-70 factor (sigma-E family)